jgi:hypothetical protein
MSMTKRVESQLNIKQVSTNSRMATARRNATIGVRRTSARRMASTSMKMASASRSTRVKGSKVEKGCQGRQMPWGADVLHERFVRATSRISFFNDDGGFLYLVSPDLGPGTLL